jgi:hypothetical protein
MVSLFHYGGASQIVAVVAGPGVVGLGAGGQAAVAAEVGGVLVVGVGGGQGQAVWIG